MKLKITYIWPTPIFTATELFDNAIKKKQITIEHPKVHAFISHLLDSSITEKSSPQGEINIDLPLRVKRDTGSFAKEAIKVNDTKIIYLEFMAYQKTVVIHDADTSINFD